MPNVTEKIHREKVGPTGTCAKCNRVERVFLSDNLCRKCHRLAYAAGRRNTRQGGRRLSPPMTEAEVAEALSPRATAAPLGTVGRGDALYRVTREDLEAELLRRFRADRAALDARIAALEGRKEGKGTAE